jgi:hypothetical protein
MGSPRSRSRSAYSEAPSAATNEGDDLELVAVADERGAELRPAQDAAIHLDRDAGGVEPEILEELVNGGPDGELTRLTVEPDADRVGGGYFFSSFLFAAR